MREIKFRQWLDRWHKMHYGIGMVKQDGHWGGPPSVNFTIDPIMQFTGLKDKNGKEIYEGDIITERKYQAVVEWDEKSLQFNCHGMLDGKNYEVIGNIYENPELLEGK
jgi:hypothetical protein